MSRNYSRSRTHTDWAILVGEAHRLQDEDFRLETLDFARQLCRRARINIERLIEELTRSGYWFACPERVYSPPREGPAWIEELALNGVHIPVFLHAWTLEVGSVSLAGTHPDWPTPAYLREGQDSGNVWYTDPLEIEIDRSSVVSQYEEWTELTAEDGPATTGPFRLAIACDDLHKANVSGGLPYSISVSSPAIDTLLLNAPDCTSLFHHVANSFCWGGFPGFAYIDDDVPELVASLRKKLLPL